jgi:hypothetical protein
MNFNFLSFEHSMGKIVNIGFCITFGTKQINLDITPLFDVKSNWLDGNGIGLSPWNPWFKPW